MKIIKAPPYNDDMHNQPMRPEDFADKYGLELYVGDRGERPHPLAPHLHRYFVHFNYIEVKGDGILTSVYGDGDTPRVAFLNYLEQIKGVVLVKDAMTLKRREFRAPEKWLPTEVDLS